MSNATTVDRPAGRTSRRLARPLVTVLASALCGSLAPLELHAQIASTEAVVALQMPGPTASVLWTIDTVTRVSGPLPGFPLDHLLVQSVALDPVDRSLLLTLHAGTSMRLVRLHYTDRRLVRSAVEATLPAGSSRLVCTNSEWLAIRGFPSGSVNVRTRWPGDSWSINRGWLSAICAEPGGTTARAVTSQPRNGTFTTFEIDLNTRSIVPGSELALLQLTNGVAVMPGAAADFVFSHPDGTFSRLQPATSTTPFGLPTSISLTGGVSAMHRAAWQTNSVFVLGTGRQPYLFEFDVNRPTGINITQLGPQLPGSPIDFAPPAGAGAAAISWAAPCSALPARLSPIGVPSLGNAAFALQFDFGTALSQPGVLALGLQTETRFALSGCPLLVDPDLLIAVPFAGPLVTTPLPVPARIELRGLALHAQGLRLDPAGLGTSNCVTLHLDP